MALMLRVAKSLRTQSKSPVKPRDRTSITTASWVIREPAAKPEIDHAGDQLGRQVVGDVPAEVLEHLRRGATARAGQAR